MANNSASNLQQTATTTTTPPVAAETAAAATLSVAATAAITSLHERLALSPAKQLSLIDVNYRAEGNANLVLALPQFCKVLRLPKRQSATSQQQQQQQEDSDCCDCSQCAARAAVQSCSQCHKPTAAANERQQQMLLLPSSAPQCCVKCQPQPNLTQTTSDAANRKVGDDENPKQNLSMLEFLSYIDVIRKIVGTAYVFEAEVVSIPCAKDRIWINRHIRDKRPAHRLTKEFCGQFGLLLPDATHLPQDVAAAIEQQRSAPQPRQQLSRLGSNLQDNAVQQAEEEWPKAKCSQLTYAIEIKPKQGWLLASSVNDLFVRKPPSANPSAATAAASMPPTTATRRNCCAASKTAANPNTRCRYCAMQYLKLKNSKISELSCYCPLKLFSGNPNLMLEALQALFECPQNNLRIFENGNLIYGSQPDDHHHSNSISISSSWQHLTQHVLPGDTLELMKHLLLECLLNDYCRAGEQQLEQGQATKQHANVERKEQQISVSKVKENVHVKAVDSAGQPHSSEAAKPTSSPSTAARKLQATSDSKPAAAELRTEVKDSTTIEITTAAATTEAAAAAAAKDAVAPGFCSRVVVGVDAAAATTQFTQVEMQSLPKNCVLQKILHLQLLAKHNLLYMLSNGYATAATRTYNTCKSLLQQFMQQAVQPSGSSSSCTSTQLSAAQLTREQQYMLGATAMDCSILIAFREVDKNISWRLSENPHVVFLPKFDKTFLTNITLVDLDPKPDSHFSKYVKQSQQISEILGEMMQ